MLQARPARPPTSRRPPHAGRTTVNPRRPELHQPDTHHPGCRWRQQRHRHRAPRGATTPRPRHGRCRRGPRRLPWSRRRPCSATAARTEHMRPCAGAVAHTGQDFGQRASELRAQTPRLTGAAHPTAQADAAVGAHQFGYIVIRRRTAADRADEHRSASLPRAFGSPGRPGHDNRRGPRRRGAASRETCRRPSRYRGNGLPFLP